MGKQDEELRDFELKRAEQKGERKAYLATLGWEGMTDEEVTWLFKYCGGNYRSKFPYHPTLEHLRELKLIDDIANKNK